jgi:WD40 repeat protein
MIELAVIEQHARERTLPALIAQLAARDDGLRWVARALRLDLGVLTAFPELVLPCLHRRGWFGRRDLARFHLDDAAAGHPIAPLRALLATWLLQGRPHAWLRALRPPGSLLDGPLVEEYRGALPAYGHPVFAAGGGAVGVVAGGAVVGWDRQSGAALSASEAAAVLVPPRPRHRIERGVGTARLVGRSGAPVPILLDDDVSLGCVADSHGGHVIAGGWYDAYCGIVVRVDPSTGAVAWRRDLRSTIDAVAVSPDGMTVLASEHQRQYLLDAVTGALRATLEVPGTAAFSPAGDEIAVVAGDTLQVWDLAELRRAARRPAPGSHGHVAAMFSPDGARLLTGDLVADAATGEPIVRLDVEGGSYAEGGPPTDGRLLAGGRFVEIGPLTGLRVWDWTTGARLLVDAERRYGHWDLVRISPDATRCLAGHTQRRPAELCLWSLDDGRRLGRIDLAATCAAFSPDGTRLALGTADGEIWLGGADGSGRSRLGNHHAPIEGLAFSCDGELVASRDRDRAVRLWGADGRPVDDCASDADDLADGVHGWRGFRARAHPLYSRHHAGMVEIVDERDRRVLARIPSSGTLIASPDGTRWAARDAHYALEYVTVAERAKLER